MAPRQPVRVRGRRSAGDVLAGLCALIAIAVLAVGVPFALLTFTGSPIPDTMPDTSVLTEQLGPDSVLEILTVIAWLAWVQLIICLLVELQAGIRGIGVPVRVPLAGGTQSLVHKLVVSALLLFTATTAIMPAITAQLQTVQPQMSNAAVYEPAHVPQQTAASLDKSPMQEKSSTTKIYRVQPPHGRHHESLWEIAQKCLGDGRRYNEIYEMNKGHVQPDGSHLHKASLIRPGWIMEMPADAEHAHIIPKAELGSYFKHGHAIPQKPSSTREQPAPKPKEQITKEQQKQKDQQGQKENEHEAPAPQQSKPPVQTEAPAQPAAPVQTQRDEQQEAFPWPEALAGTSLLAAGLLTALGRRRQNQMLKRPFGRMIVRPEGEAALAEQALRIGADADSVRVLDLGLRQLSKALAAQGRTLPTVYGVHLGKESLDLWIAPADDDAPPPWEAHDNGQVWRLHTGVIAQFDPKDLTDVLAPYPGLISLGTDGSGRVLADLEAAHGLIALDGPPEQRKEALAAMAVELATNQWSDHMRLTLVGFGDDLQAIAPDRIRCLPSLAEALPELEARGAEVRAALQASGADSVLTGRCRGTFGEAWMPHYLIMADQPSQADAQRLVTLARTGQRMASGYLVAGSVEAATWHWTIDPEGVLQAGVLGFEVDAQRIPEPQYRAVADLFRTAGRLDGVKLPDPTGEQPFGAAAGEQKPAVDIRVLGPIGIEAPGPIEDSRRELCTELLVYLATHPSGVHPTVLSSAIWPRGVTAGVRDATIAMASDWIGRDSRGRPNLYSDERGRIKLGSEVRVDWQVFRWLIWRSAAEPGSEQAYLSYALDLVRGPLMAGRPRGRYTWLANDELEYEAAARVVDVAHRLVVMRLDETDPRGAVAAARAGLSLAPDDEGLWRDLLRATDATGDQTAVRVVVDELRGRADLDLLQPETEALMDDLQPHQYVRGA